MSKRKRDPTFAASEKFALIDLVAKHFDVVESKKTDNVNIKMKNDEWQKIATEFNAISSIHPRECSVLKNLWENLKKRAKQSQTLRNQHFLGTGGGPPKKFDEDPITDRVLELIQTRVTGFVNNFDSDGTLVLASGNTQDGEGTSASILILPAPENVIDEDCSNDANTQANNEVSEEIIDMDWSQYTPSMLRVAKNPALARPRSPLPDEQLASNNEQEIAPPLPIADLQLPMAEAQPTTSRAQENHQALNTPQRTMTTRVTPAAMSAASTSRRRPVSRREREANNLTTERLNTLLRCNTHAEEEHAIQIRILKLQEEREKLRLQEQLEILEQEKLKTKQEKVKLEILMKKLNDQYFPFEPISLSL
ncbi:myb/SANT-like DNA-binding domain-containing protein 3 [Ostrinia furnacalis]|uniref:myb/SANT-like DNA-binding domain-containing protein 3 n=1 Tax=Ostrinia furnacalis TaxID=93504 RepID=UPI00103F47D1|nr:myb/SANT-like DNA-binding domain-containing protein 3 [Ostrinia furnacalis]